MILLIGRKAREVRHIVKALNEGFATYDQTAYPTEDELRNKFWRLAQLLGAARG